MLIGSAEKSTRKSEEKNERIQLPQAPVIKLLGSASVVVATLGGSEVRYA